MSQSPRKLNAYLISTSGYGQKFAPVRECILKAFEELDLNPQGYELPDFKTLPNLTLTENCLRNMESADLLVIVLNGRYGYIEPGQTVSVTHAEIDAALQSKKPYIVFVQNNLQALLDYIYNPNPENKEKIGKFFKKEPRSAEQHIQLLKSISSHNWCSYPKNDPQATVDLIKSKISGFAPYFVDKLVCAQRKDIEIVMQDTWINALPQSINLLYAANGVAQSGKLSNICQKKLSKCSVFIVGESGAGKSFCLRETYLHYAHRYHRSQVWGNDRIPIFLEFRSYTPKTFNKIEYINSLFQKHLNCIPPKFVIDHILKNDCLFFFDAIDEWCHSGSYSDLSNILSSLDSRFILSTRSSTYRRVAVDISVHHAAACVVTVYGWRPEDLENYATNCISDPQQAKRLLSVLKGCGERTVLKGKQITYFSPLIASMAVQCLQSPDIAFEQNFSIGDLFHQTVDQCLQREMHRKHLPASESLLTEWKAYLSRVCMFVYLAVSLKKRPNSLRDLDDYLAQDSATIRNDCHGILPLFFTVGTGNFYPKHMMIVYYFIAEQAIRLVQQRDYTLFAKHHFPSETNRMIGDFYTALPSNELRAIFDDMCSYTQTVTEEASRMLLYYFIPRLARGSSDLEEPVRDFLKQAKDREEGHHCCLVSILNCLTQLGDMRAEEDYLSLVLEKSAFCDHNRGANLVYQQDRPDKSPTFNDTDNNPEWQSTAQSFIEHCQSKEQRHKSLRRVEFATMISMIETGKTIYPFFKDYFCNLTSDQLIASTFDDEYCKFLKSKEVNAQDVQKRKDSLACLLTKLQKAMGERLPD